VLKPSRISSTRLYIHCLFIYCKAAHRQLHRASYTAHGDLYVRCV
jgi:hypothetical protein